MAKKQVKSRVTEKVENKESITTPSEKSVEDIEEDLQLPSSSDDEEEEDIEQEELSEEEEEQEEDNINGLSDDDDDDEEDEDESKKKQIKANKSGHSVNKIIKTSEETTGTSTTTKTTKSKSGVIYIGRLPSGFQESELKTYFSQFGDVINLKLARNKKTGKTKHYGFIEFDSFEVAKVAAETMNNYLLFGHLIKCEVVEKPHEDTFKHGNRKFKVIPWKKIAKEKHEKSRTEEEWKVLIAKFEESKKKKQEELKSKGIDFDVSAI
ncbi:RNA-binding protein, putative [Candida dubliniensis CD36]|uniref:RNA-binding protein, putative n=1 Tax=Candida dubliniensis (strain CD36 / ATCC MYA-646 / CBS 7987 / NCPF 3949 / NRRL Y-17841) TaxID=573826 RepID=B9WJH4_CANDC|nr:RNA-binding protein, putative [Candida dubliniensis CD36]CAX40616.1 RNA-binding protein, putative [Candida dubliniensis CD36]